MVIMNKVIKDEHINSLQGVHAEYDRVRFETCQNYVGVLIILFIVLPLHRLSLEYFLPVYGTLIMVEADLLMPILCNAHYYILLR